MNEATAMQVFFELHANLPREGPGNDAATAQALSLVPNLPEHPQILDVGCGPGMQTLALARLTSGHITAVDFYQSYLDRLTATAEQAGLGDRITPCKADMADLPFPPASFDLIWAEGSAYIMEFGNALRQWRSLLKRPGYLAATEVSWLRDDPPTPVATFWQAEYPGMQSIEANLGLTKAAGYRPIAHFILPEETWWQHYYTPLEARLSTLKAQYGSNPDAMEVLDMHQREIDIYRQYADYYGYVFYILQVEEG